MKFSEVKLGEQYRVVYDFVFPEQEFIGLVGTATELNQHSQMILLTFDVDRPVKIFPYIAEELEPIQPEPSES